MGTDVLMTQFLNQFLLKRWRNSMLQPLGLVVNLIPRHAEDFRQHALNQVMSKDSSFGNRPTFRVELNAAVILSHDHAVLLQAFQRIGDRRWRNGKPMSERSG